MPFDVNVPVSGDIVIGIWFGAYNLGQRLHSRPAAAYAFHTAWFEDRQVERITMHQMDAADPALFPPGEHPDSAGQDSSQEDSDQQLLS